MAPSGPTSPTAARTRARFPEVAAERGHYESFYLKAGHPAEPLAVWIRYTVHKRPGAEPTASLWFTLFDGRGEPPSASKVTVGADRLGAGDGDYIRIGDARLGPGHASGAASSDRLEARWELEFEPGDEPLRHLPREWMYTAPLPRTKLESPHPGTVFSGTLTVDGRSIAVERWPGMVGHNWGREHAERWIWLHGTGFGEDAAAGWLDAGFGRIRVGPVTTPWIANGRLVLGARAHRLGGLGRARSTQVTEAVERCEFVLPGEDVTVRGTVEAPRSDSVAWIYADPDGGEHHTVNCSIATLRLEVVRDGAAPMRLETRHGATYELGMREQDHGVPVQPFPDG